MNFRKQLNDLITRADDAIPYRWHVIGVIILSLLAAAAVVWAIENINLIHTLQQAIWEQRTP